VKVLFDTNVVLDHLLAREPFVDPAERLLSLVDSGALEGVVCSTTVTTIHYLAAKAVGASRAADYIRELLVIFDVASCLYSMYG
jgi:predicted nucleic acid-binding protein